MIHGSDLYVYDTLNDHNGIRAYGLTSGRLEWSAATPEIPGETSMQYVDGIVIVSMVDTDGSGEHTVSFDGRTGRRLWSNDFGYATHTTGGVLVESAPAPPGFNFPGTVRTGTFRLLDLHTGQVRWTLDVPDNCMTDVGNPGAGLPNTLVELCSSESRLTAFGLADGKISATRQIPLGDPADNDALPVADRIEVPALVVADGTLLIAHPSRPLPTIDAYAMDDLDSLWAGLPLIDGQDVEQCGPDLCVYVEASLSSMLDLRTGKQVGLAPPASTDLPPIGSLALAPVGAPITFAPATLVSSIGADASISVQPIGAPSATKVLASRQVGRASTIEILHGVDVRSCVTITGFLACSTAPDRLTVWRLPRV
jgi:hypothetical protein